MKNNGFKLLLLILILITILGIVIWHSPFVSIYLLFKNGESISFLLKRLLLFIGDIVIFNILLVVSLALAKRGDDDESTEQ